MRTSTIRIGSGAGMADDRIPPAAAIAERAGLDYLVMECLAERTIARETQSRLKNPDSGYTPSLVERLRAVLPPCHENGTRIVTNMGAANPHAAARLAAREMEDLGLGRKSIAVVSGDDVMEIIRASAGLRTLEDGEPLEALLPGLISANAYLGADAVRAALDTGADLVITGRVADPSLFVAPMLHHFGWAEDDWERLAPATLAGHLLECSAQLTGGCFADPPLKEVPDLADLGYPFVDVSEAGDIVFSKTPGTGGRIDRQTCTEQLLYEIHDPSAYVTPDCILDVTDVEFRQEAHDRVRAIGAKARPRTDSYKVVVGYADGYIGAGEMGFAGINAVARAKLGAETVRQRLARRGFAYPEFKVDLIGMSSLHGGLDERPEPYEVRLRIAARTHDRKAAAAVGAEVRSLHMQGPTGAGGGYSLGVQEVLAVKSVLLPRHLVHPRVEVL